MEIIVGCCGFPISRKKYYEIFNSVEIQQTFYSFPRESTVGKWREEAPRDFKFSMKAFQGVTHDVNSPTWKKSKIENYKELKGKVGYLRPTKEVFNFWNKTLEIAKILKAEIIVIQTPSSFKDSEENIENANEFFKEIKREGMKIGVELRGWSEESIEELCKKYDLIDITDPFKRPPVYYKDTVYFRLHGRYEGNRIIYSYDYSKKELEKLKEIIKGLDTNEVWVMFNNSYMLKNAKEFLEII